MPGEMMFTPEVHDGNPVIMIRFKYNPPACGGSEKTAGQEMEPNA
jgi:hypothetical protein